MSEKKTTTKTALEGITVIDLSRILAGPWASQTLADLGAKVIKIERPKIGDDTRTWGPPFLKKAKEAESAQSAYFHCANRNKQSISIDITSIRGQKLIKEMVTKADVFIENFKVGGLEKYGLDYQSLKQINPNLVYCSITGFGQTGPFAIKAGYDAMIQGEGGLMSLTGEPNGSPMKVGVALVDVMTGLYSCNAILAALMARQHINEGQYIDISLLDVQVAALANQGMNYLTTGENPNRLGNEHPNIVPYQTFATQDGSIILAIGNDHQFSSFCRLCQCEQLSNDEKYKRNEARVTNRSTLIPIIAEKIANRPTAWWIDQLEKIFVPCGPVNTLKEVFSHPQVKHRKMVRKIPDNNSNLITTVASPINLSSTPLQYKSASPNLGQHSYQVLDDFLNYKQEEIAQLFKDEIVF